VPTRCTGLVRGLWVGIVTRFVDGSSARLENMAKGTLWGDWENHSEDVDGDEGVGGEGDGGDMRGGGNGDGRNVTRKLIKSAGGFCFLLQIAFHVPYVTRLRGISFQSHHTS